MFHILYEKSPLHQHSFKEVLNDVFEKPFSQCLWLKTEHELIGLKRQNKNLGDCLLDFFLMYL